MKCDKIPVVIMAGGKAKPDIVAATGVDNRALIPFRGKTLLDHVVDCIEKVEALGDIYVVGDLPSSSKYHSIPDQGDFVGNLLAGISRVGDSPRVLVAAGDAPFLTPESLNDLISAPVPPYTDIIYPVVPVELCYAKYPGMKRTSVCLKEGVVTGGNVMVFRPEFINIQSDIIRSAYAARKSPLKLAMMLGPVVCLRAIISLFIIKGSLSIRVLETAAGKMLGGRAFAYVSSYPEIATDVDRASDLQALN